MPTPSRNDVLAATSLEDWVKVTDKEGKDGACAHDDGRHAEPIQTVQADLSGCVDACASNSACVAVSFQTDCSFDLCDCLLDAAPEGGLVYNSVDTEKYSNYECWMPVSSYRGN